MIEIHNLPDKPKRYIVAQYCMDEGYWFWGSYDNEENARYVARMLAEKYSIEEKMMSDYIKTKEYKFPDGETVTAYFDEYGIAKITIQALDAIFDNFINSADRVEVVRCKDCKFIRCGGDERNGILYFCSQDCKAKKSSDFCSYGERADNE